MDSIINQAGNELQGANTAETERLQKEVHKNLALLKDKTDLDGFSNALAFLEEWKSKNFAFNSAQLEEIQRARRWLDLRTANQADKSDNQKTDAVATGREQKNTSLARNGTPAPDVEEAHRLLDEIRSTNDLIKRYDLLAQIQVLAPEEDEGLQAEIERVRNGLHAQARPIAIINLQLLKDNTDYDKFSSALAILELLANQQYPFTDKQPDEIKAARRWKDDKNIHDTGFVSAAQTGELQDAFLIYRQWVELPAEKKERTYLVDGVSVTQNDYTIRIQRAWQRNSSATCTKRLQKMQATAKTDPNMARATLEHDLVAQVEKEVDNGFAKAREKRKIPEFPYTDEDKTRIKDYIRQLEEACQIAGNAKQCRDDAFKSNVPYIRYDLLVKAHDLVWRPPNDPNSYGLPFIDDDIYRVFQPAVQGRHDEIKAKVDITQQEIERLPHLSAENFPKQAIHLEKKLADQKGQTELWPGTGYVLNITIPGEPDKFKIEKPAVLETLGSRCQAIAARLAELQSVYEHLIKSDQKIRDSLVSNISSVRKDGLQTFDSLKEAPQIQNFFIFTELSGFVVQQGGFESGENNIRERFSASDWSGVLDLCNKVEAKPNYSEKCPAEIKTNIASWKRAADVNLRVHKLKELVEKENYRVANKVLEGLCTIKADLQPIQKEVDQIEKVKESGGAMLDFYALALSPYRLEKHILMDILLEMDDIFDRFKQLSSQDKGIVRQILGGDRGAVSREQFEDNVLNYLDRTFTNTSFEQKSLLVKKLRFVAGLPVETGEEWPKVANSLAKYEARLLAGYLTSILKHSVMNILIAANAQINQGLGKLDISPTIQAVYEYEINMSDSEREILRKVEIAWAKVSSQSLSPNQSEERKIIWETVKSHFGLIEDVRADYSAAMTNWYMKQAEKDREDKKYQDSLDMIIKGFKDENVGTVWQLYLEQAKTCLEMDKFEEAKAALDHFGVGLAHSETRETKLLRTRIELGKRHKLHENDPLEELKALMEYHKTVSSIIDMNLVDGRIWDVYEAGKKGFSRNFIEKIDLKREMAWGNFLHLRGLEDIYRGLYPNTIRDSDKFMVQLLPSLYVAGIDLLKQCEEFLDRKSVSLVDSFAIGSPLQVQMDSYEQFLKDLNKSTPDKETSLEKVVENIIKINASTAEMEEKLLADLQQAIIKQEKGKRIKYESFLENKANLDQKMKDLASSQQKWESAKEPNLWFDAAKKALQGQAGNADPWDFIKNKFTEGDYIYLEIKNLKQTIIPKWKDDLELLNKYYDKLRETYKNEIFTNADVAAGTKSDYLYNSGEQLNDARSCADKIQNGLSSLPDFSLTGAHADVIKKLKEELIVLNSYTGKRVNGLEEIENSISIHQQEQQDWEKYKQAEEQLLSTLRQDVSKFKAHFTVFKSQYDRVRRSLKVQDNERSHVLQDYITAVEILDQDRNRTLINLPPIPVIARPITINNDPTGVQAEDVDHSQRSLWNMILDLLFLGRKEARPVEDILVEDVRFIAGNDFPLYKHALHLDALIKEAAIRAPGRPDEKRVSSRKAKKLQLDCDTVLQTRAGLEAQLVDTNGKYKACINKWTFPDKSLFKGNLDKRQYRNLASTIIEADLIGTPSDEEKNTLETYRGLLIRVRESQRR